MTTQEQAFRVYYNSMADAELLRTALHKDSYIPLAQKLMSEEMDKRRLAVPPGGPSAAPTPPSGVFARLRYRVGRR